MRNIRERNEGTLIVSYENTNKREKIKEAVQVEFTNKYNDKKQNKRRAKREEKNKIDLLMKKMTVNQAGKEKKDLKVIVNISFYSEYKAKKSNQWKYNSNSRCHPKEPTL